MLNRLGYQAATPEVAPSFMVTSFQGPLEKTFEFLKDTGYTGIELMMREPGKMDRGRIIGLSERYDLPVLMLCTGEIYGQDRLSFMDTDEKVREAAVRRVCGFIDLAGDLGAQVNIGRVRGGYSEKVRPEDSFRWAMDGFSRILESAERRGVTIALEPLNILQGNFINSTREGIEFVRRFDSRHLRIMLDLFHMNIEDRDLLDSIRESWGMFSYVHLTDSNRRYPGACKFDFDAIFRVLAEGSYEGPLSVEVFQIPDQETAARKSIETVLPLGEKYFPENDLTS